MRTEKNTKGRKAGETRTQERAIPVGFSRLDVIMPVGRSRLEQQAILEEGGGGRVPRRLPRG